MGTDDTPSAGNGIACSAAQNGLRAVISTVSAKESVAVGIVSVDRAVDCINSVMSAALAVLSFVVNLRTLDLNFADAEVSLEVGQQILRISVSRASRCSWVKLKGASKS